MKVLGNRKKYSLKTHYLFVKYLLFVCKILTNFLLFQITNLFQKIVGQPVNYVTQKSTNERPLSGPLHKHESDSNINVCLGAERLHSLCRGLEYFLKISYFIQNLLRWQFFFLLISRLFVWASRQHCSIYKKKYKNEQPLCLWWHRYSPNVHRMYF